MAIDKIPKIIVPGKDEKKERSFRFTKRSCGLVLFFLIIILILYTLFFSSVFKVKKIEVKGDNLVEGEKVKKLVEFALGNENNILLFDDSSIEKTIKDNFSLIQSVAIQKGLPDTLRILIIERKPVIFWQTQDKKYLVDVEGYAYKEASPENKEMIETVFDVQNLPVEEGQRVVSRNFISYLEHVKNNIKVIAGLDYERFEVHETTFDLVVRTKSGFSVFFDTNRSPEEGLDDLRRVLLHLQGKKPKEYIDLRVEGWAYYK